MRIIKFLKRKVGLIILPVFILSLSTSILIGSDNKDYLKISIIDVGQGDGICVNLNNGSGLMFDGGSSSKKNLGEYTLLPFFNAYGIKKIKYWFVSHSDTDHISGLVEILSNYKDSEIIISNIVLPGYRMDDDKYSQIINFADKYNIKILNMVSKDFIKINDEITLDCFYPIDTQFEDHNDESLNIMFSYKDFQMLFTGDLGANRDELIADYYTKCYKNNDLEILKVAHHGSKNSTSDLLLDTLMPEVAVISAGENNSYGHPSKEVIDKLSSRKIKIYSTVTLGEIDIKTNGKKYEIKSFK